MRRLWWDGAALSTERGAPGRMLLADARPLDGEPRVADAWANVCVLADPAAVIRFDEPEVQQARRDALAWWIPLLGDDLVCVTTLAVDASGYGGAITVARSPARFADDPFARLFAATVIRTSRFATVAPPPGPVIERYAGTPWPGGHF